ncbi:MAG: M36 family metallopeptidase [Candidatus Eisenbacteria bacterium]
MARPAFTIPSAPHLPAWPLALLAALLAASSLPLPVAADMAVSSHRIAPAPPAPAAVAGEARTSTARPSAARAAEWAAARAEAARQVPADVGSLDERFGVPSMLRLHAPAPAAVPGKEFTPAFAAREHLRFVAPWYRLGAADLESAELREVHDTGSGGIIATFTQRVDGLEVYGEAVKVLMNRGLGLVAVTGHITGGASTKAGAASRFARTASDALAAALADFDGTPANRASFRQGPAAEGGYDTWTVAAAPGKPGTSSANPAQPEPERTVRVKRVLYHEPDGLVPAYVLELARADAAYAYVVSAADGSVLARHDQMANDAYTYRAYVDAASPYAPLDGPQGNAMTPHPTGLPDNSMPSGWASMGLRNLQNIPFSMNDPWLPAGATVTTGNNVDAYADLVAPDGYGAGDVRPTTNSTNTFNRIYNTGLAPSADQTQQMAATTNAFFVTNWLHDWFYDSGFNEAAGNAQASNFGRGGVQGDRMLVETLDYSGTNNANMYTPADGGSPRMQMYVWNPPGVSLCNVTGPPSVAGSKVFSGANTNPASFTVSGNIVRAVSGTFSSSATASLAVGSGPEWVHVADLNADGIPDLASANYSSNDVSVRLGTGGGAFAAPVSYAMGTGLYTVMTGDFNNDGKLDLVSANNASANISVRLGTGGGAFGARTNFAAGGNPAVATVGRLNADGNDDVVVANYGSSSVSVFLGNGAGGFAAKVDYATGLNPNWAALGDVNNDGKLDIVTANYIGSTISVLLGTGTGTFGAKTDFAVGTNPLTLSLADLNGDGKLDVVVANYAANTIGVLLGTGTGSFGAMTSYACPTGPVTVTTGDVTADGIPDVAVCCDNVSQVAVLANNGAGVLGAATSFAVGNTPYGVAIADLTGDGTPDLVSANFSTNNLTLLTGAITTPAALCPPFTSVLANRVVLCEFNGVCNVDVQILAAQTQGAVAAIVRSPLASPLPLSLPAVGITIPVVVLGANDANALTAALRAGSSLKASLQVTPSLPRDCALDNLIVAHEWGHYLSGRLIGNGSGLYNLQGAGMGEGWSDFVALLMSVRPEDALVAGNNSWQGVFASGGYVLHNSATADNGYYFGTRRYPYSTDMTRNPLTFAHIQDGVPLPAGAPRAPYAESNAMSEVHNTGEVWCSMLWECYAALLRDSGRLTFAQARDRMKQYLVASLKLTPSAPTFVEARDAVLLAAAANDTADFNRFANAFAKRGIGLGAVAPNRYADGNIGVTQSFAWGGDLQIAAMYAADSARTCDHDGYIDAGEDGLVTLVVSSPALSGTLAHTTATFWSSNPFLSFENGGVLHLPTLVANSSVSGSIRMHCGNPVGIQLQDIHVSVTDPALANPTPRTADGALWGNADNGFAKRDSVEARDLNWSAVTAPGSTTAAAWTAAAVSWIPLNHVFFVPNADHVEDQSLVTPPIVVGAGPFTFSFQTAFWFEQNYDGGVVEITQDGGATWTDLGPTLTPAYNGTIDPGYGNPLAGRAAYTWMSPSYPGYSTVTANLGTTYAGKTVQIRLRAGSDESMVQWGWMVDAIAVTGSTNSPFRVPVPDTTPCSFAAVDDALPTQLAFAITGANPVRGDATFRFALPTRSHVRIGLYDVSGRLVATLADGTFDTGTFDARWHRASGERVGPGVYFARLTQGGQTRTTRVCVLQ